MRFQVGFTGTRNGLTGPQKDALRAILLSLFEGTLKDDHSAWLHHGDCLGADATCHEIAREIGFCICLHPPTEDTLRAFLDKDCEEEFPELPYLARNRQIVENADVLVACPEGPETVRSGTWSTVRLARKRGVPVIVVWPDGRVEREQP